MLRVDDEALGIRSTVPVILPTAPRFATITPLHPRALTARVLPCALATIATAVAAAPQAATPAPAIPIRRLAPAEATTREPLGLVNGLKQFADGRVIVNDVARQRLVVFDPALATFTVSADSGGTGATLYPRSFSTGGLYYYPGDSALFPDMAMQMFVMIGPDGTMGRAVAHPRPRDMANIVQALAGSPACDPQGRFIYRAAPRAAAAPAPGAAPVPWRARDSSAIVRADFETRMVDTIASISLPIVPRTEVKRDARGNPSATLLVNPVPLSPDEWAVLSDGSLAIVRAHDYHIDWVYPDGTRASTPRMPFDWRRLTDADKQAKVDSVKRIIDSLSTAPRPYGSVISRRAGQTKPDTVAPVIEFVPLAEMLDYLPPIRAGTVKADRDNHLWILPTTTLRAAGGGALYDIIDTHGAIIERVQLPRGRAIAGFGPGGAVYLMFGNRTRGFTIERTHVVR
jgi:hypothetical protein